MELVDGRKDWSSLELKPVRLGGESRVNGVDGSTPTIVGGHVVLPG